MRATIACSGVEDELARGIASPASAGVPAVVPDLATLDRERNARAGGGLFHAQPGERNRHLDDPFLVVVAHLVQGAVAIDRQTRAAVPRRVALPPVCRRRAEGIGDRAQDRYRDDANLVRSEEHTSELQSLRHLVCRLLLEKKKNNKPQSEVAYNNKKAMAAARRAWSASMASSKAGRSFTS